MDLEAEMKAFRDKGRKNEETLKVQLHEVKQKLANSTQNLMSYVQRENVELLAATQKHRQETEEKLQDMNGRIEFVDDRLMSSYPTKSELERRINEAKRSTKNVKPVSDDKNHLLLASFGLEPLVACCRHYFFRLFYD